MSLAPKPKVSICVPNLNTRPYLPERFETIFNQTLRDWELIVCDSFSDDGSWEYIQELAAREPRMRIFQSPRNGIYAGFNDCIEKAGGEYVYIATSDDTMMPECLEKMAAALDQNPECGLCQCELVVIDEKGTAFPSAQQWTHYTLGSYDENLVSRKNKRLAPHDGIVHPALFTIYTSVTQLLIRRRVFDRVGLFDGRWGTVSDFEWDMRASLVESCIYVPEKLATWRRHAAQATQANYSVSMRLKMIEMARTAYGRARACDGTAIEHINIEEWLYFLKRDVVELGCEGTKGSARKIFFLLGQLGRYPRQVIDFALSRFLGRKNWGQSNCAERYGRLKRLLKKCGVSAPIFE